MKKHLWLFAILITLKTWAQQEIHYSQYLYEKLLYNPAYAGNNGDNTSLTFLHKNQWAAIDQTFNAYAFALNTSFSQERIGIGLNLQSENLSAYRLTYLQVPVSYKVKIENGFLSFGLEAGIRTANYDYAALNIREPEDKVLNTLNSIHPDASFGLFYRKETYYLGFSVKHLLPNTSYNSQFKKEITNRTSYALFAYKIFLTPNLNLIPSSIMRISGSKYYVDLGGHLEYHDFVWLGAFYRSNKQFTIQTAFVVNRLVKKINNKLLIGYALDYGYSNLYPFSGASHEITLKYDIKKRPNPEHLLKRRKTISPLFF